MKVPNEFKTNKFVIERQNLLAKAGYEAMAAYAATIGESYSSWENLNDDGKKYQIDRFANLNRFSLKDPRNAYNLSEKNDYDSLSDNEKIKCQIFYNVVDAMTRSLPTIYVEIIGAAIINTKAIRKSRECAFCGYTSCSASCGRQRY